MSINQSSENLLYQTYRNAGPTPALLIPAAITFTIAYVGVLMNSFVVAVTFGTKALHGTANFLLALISIFELLHQSGHAIFFVIVVSGINFISKYLSARLNLYMIFGLNCSLCGMACAAFDRLFAVVATHRHRRLNKPLYLGALLSICVCYGVYVCFIVFHYNTYDEAGSPTTGCISELLEGPVGETFFQHTIALNLVSTLLYLVLWMVIRFKKGVTKETNGRVLKSLVIILVINIGGYAVTLSIYQILFHLHPGILNPVLTWHIGFISGFLLNMGAGCNAIVLYVNSTDYRKAFKRYLSSLGLAPKSWQLLQQQNSHHLWSTRVNPQQQQLQSTGSAARTARSTAIANGGQSQMVMVQITR